MAGLKSWIGASAGDVMTRLAAQMISTVVIARVLSAEDFGLASMILTSVAIFGAFVSLPFEEALTQRSNLNTGHLETALFVSLALTLAALGIVLAVGPFLARMAGAPDLAIWLPIATLFLFGQGPGSIARAVARRRRKFVAMAIGGSSSVVISSAVAIVAALYGWGVFALVLQRMLPVVIYPVIALSAAGMAGRKAMVWPRWNRDRFNDIFRFSWLHLARVTVDYTTPAVLTFMVNAFFGTVVLGQLNVAMRVTEPLKSGIASVGHNLVLSFLVRLQSDVEKLARSTMDTIANIATLAVPAFLGLGVCSPLLLPILVGPGWDAAIPLSRVVCVAAAISVPFRYLYSGYSALGRPELSLACTIAGLVTMVAGLELVAHTTGAHALAFPIVATEAAAATLGVVFYAGIAGAKVLAPLLKVARIWVASVLMVVILDIAFLRFQPFESHSLRLAVMVLAGGAAYSLLLFVICRPCFDMLRGFVRPGKE